MEWFSLTLVIVAVLVIVGGVILAFWAALSRIQAISVDLAKMEETIAVFRQKAPSEKLSEIEGFLGTLRKEFVALMESQDDFRDKCQRETARQRSLLERRVGKPRQGYRSDTKSQAETEEDLPERITQAEAAEMNAAAASSDGNSSQRDSRDDVRRRIRDAYFRARRPPA